MFFYKLDDLAVALLKQRMGNANTNVRLLCGEM